MIVRNTIEFTFILVTWGLIQLLIQRNLMPGMAMAMIILISLTKTTFFGVENIRQLFEATRSNQPYHRFMILMLVNMTQIIVSFGLDYHCMFLVDRNCFSVELTNATQSETVFEFIYYSTLNFTFFGYGDVTPQTVPAKFVTMTEIILAFVTVIFLLSDFISLKESLASPTPKGQSSRTMAPEESRGPVQ